MVVATGVPPAFSPLQLFEDTVSFCYFPADMPIFTLQTTECYDGESRKCENRRDSTVELLVVAVLGESQALQTTQVEMVPTTNRPIS